MKNIQISYELFLYMVHYHLHGEEEFYEDIQRGLEQKLDAMLKHQLYSQYKTAPTEEQREKARKEYLDLRGVPESFRWTNSPWKQ
ncbi:MAG: complexin-2 [Bacillus sp. (in: firmicutes)]